MVEAFAVFGPTGELLDASGPFHAMVGSSALPRQPSVPDRLLLDLGFTGVPGSPGLLQKDGRRVRQHLRRTASGLTLLALEAVAEERAGEPSREKFLSVASHDLRGTVSNIRAYAGLMLDGQVQPAPKMRRWLEVIARNADKALVSLKEFFDSAYAQAGILEVDREPQDLEPFLRSALERVQGAVTGQVAEISAAIQEHLPQVSVDGAALDHVLCAFLEHGLARAPEGSRLELFARSLDREVIVGVTDSGPPLSEMDAAVAFDAELRAAREGRLAAGFKLGVAGAEVAAHGGRVGIERASDRTTFFFTLLL
jgi:two-component system, OmpR family, sensor kinase